MLAYYGHKAQWPPLYACLADMPVEVGDVFFFCLGYDQGKDQEERMVQHGLEKARELQESLSRR